MAISKEVKIGAIVFSGIIVLYFGINYLKGKDFFSSEKHVYALYERVEGLAPSNIIEINGLKAGFVREIKLLPDHSGRILVTMNLQSGLKIPRNSVAQIYSTDLLGTKGIRLIFGTSKEDLQDGDTLFADLQKSLSEEVNAQVAPVKQKAENLLASLDSVAQILRDVFNEETKQNLKNSFASISTSLRSIQKITTNIDTLKIKQILANVESFTHNFSAISDTLKRANLAGTIENLKKTVDEASAVFEKINKGKGSMGKLMNDDSLYVNLNAASKSLDELLKDLKANPKRYVHISVFGGKGK